MHADAESDTPPLQETVTRRVPVIMATLSAEAAEQGRYVMDALQRQLQLPTGEDTHEPAWDVAPLRRSDLDESTPLPFALVIVQADLGALRTAYAQLKALAPRRPSCGVLIMGARDTSSGARYYRRLAMGAVRFLDLPLLNLGLCPQRGQDFGSRLAGLAQRIHDTCLLHRPAPAAAPPRRLD